MSLQTAKKYLAKYNKSEHVLEFNVSSATVILAAQAIGTTEARIAKTLAFNLGGDIAQTVLIVTAGDVKVDNKKFKEFFAVKAKMLKTEELLIKVGHEVGGVCPFGVNAGVEVYLDESLKRFTSVFPACGSVNSAIEMRPDELFNISCAKAWVDLTTT